MSTDTTLTAAKSQKIVVNDDGPLSFMMDTGKFEQMQRLASIMANSSLLPAHLRIEKVNGKDQLLPAEVRHANCFRIVNQAIRWQIDPFAMLDATYVVHGKLGYEGKLVAAIVNARAGLEGRLSCTYNAATGDDLTVTVLGRFAGEEEYRTVELRLGDAKTDNQMWKKDPQQKLWYSGVTKWARRHCPEVILGVLTDDDLERIRTDRDQSAVNLIEGSRSDQVAALLSEPSDDAIADAILSDSRSGSADDSNPYISVSPGEGEESAAYVKRLLAEIKESADVGFLDYVVLCAGTLEEDGFLEDSQHGKIVDAVNKRMDRIEELNSKGMLV